MAGHNFAKAKSRPATTVWFCGVLSALALLYRHRLRQIPGLVNRAAAQGGYVVGEQL